jgi:hypothetical protein
MESSQLTVEIKRLSPIRLLSSSRRAISILFGADAYQSGMIIHPV